MADRNNKSRKVTRYPQNLNNINIGMIFFAVIAIYIIISVAYNHLCTTPKREYCTNQQR